MLALHRPGHAGSALLASCRRRRRARPGPSLADRLPGRRDGTSTAGRGTGSGRRAWPAPPSSSCSTTTSPPTLGTVNRRPARATRWPAPAPSRASAGPADRPLACYTGRSRHRASSSLTVSGSPAGASVDADRGHRRALFEEHRSGGTCAAALVGGVSSTGPAPCDGVTAVDLHRYGATSDETAGLIDVGAAPLGERACRPRDRLAAPRDRLASALGGGGTARGGPPAGPPAAGRSTPAPDLIDGSPSSTSRPGGRRTTWWPGAGGIFGQQQGRPRRHPRPRRHRRARSSALGRATRLLRFLTGAAQDLRGRGRARRRDVDPRRRRRGRRRPTTWPASTLADVAGRGGRVRRRHRAGPADGVGREGRRPAPARAGPGGRRGRAGAPAGHRPPLRRRAATAEPARAPHRGRLLVGHLRPHAGRRPRHAPSGGGAHLRGLRRTAVGSFTLAEARPLDELGRRRTCCRRPAALARPAPRSTVDDAGRGRRRPRHGARPSAASAPATARGPCSTAPARRCWPCTSCTATAGSKPSVVDAGGRPRSSRRDLMEVIRDLDALPAPAGGHGGHHRRLRRRPPRPPGRHRRGPAPGRRRAGLRDRGRHLRPPPGRWSSGPSRRRCCSPTSTRSSSCWPPPASTTRSSSTSTRSGPQESAEDFVARGAGRLPRRPGSSWSARTSTSATSAGATSPCSSAMGAELGFDGRRPRPRRRRRQRRPTDADRCRRPPSARALRRRRRSPRPTRCSAGRHEVRGSVEPRRPAGPRARASRPPTSPCPATSCCPADGIYAGWYVRPDGSRAPRRHLPRPPADVLRAGPRLAARGPPARLRRRPLRRARPGPLRRPPAGRGEVRLGRRPRRPDRRRLRRRPAQCSRSDHARATIQSTRRVVADGRPMSPCAEPIGRAAKAGTTGGRPVGAPGSSASTRPDGHAGRRPDRRRSRRRRRRVGAPRLARHTHHPLRRPPGRRGRLRPGRPARARPRLLRRGHPLRPDAVAPGRRWASRSSPSTPPATAAPRACPPAAPDLGGLRRAARPGASTTSASGGPSSPATRWAAGSSPSWPPASPSGPSPSSCSTPSSATPGTAWCSLFRVAPPLLGRRRRRRSSSTPLTTVPVFRDPRQAVKLGRLVGPDARRPRPPARGG